MNALGTAADIVSIFGACISIYVAIRIRQLSKPWLFTGRINDHKRQLNVIGNRLNILLASSQVSFTDFTTIFPELKSTLNQLATNGTGRISKNAKGIARRIEAAQKDRRKVQVFEFCEELMTAVREIEAELGQEIANHKITPIR